LLPFICLPSGRLPTLPLCGRACLASVWDFPDGALFLSPLFEFLERCVFPGRVEVVESFCVDWTSLVAFCFDVSVLDSSFFVSSFSILGVVAFSCFVSVFVDVACFSVSGLDSSFLASTFLGASCRISFFLGSTCLIASVLDTSLTTSCIANSSFEIVSWVETSCFFCLVSAFLLLISVRS